MDANTPDDVEGPPAKGPSEPPSLNETGVISGDGGPLETFWTAGPAEKVWGRPSPIARFVDIGLVAAALAAYYVLSVVAVAGRALPAAERLGYQIGTISVGIAIALGLRWLYLRRSISVRPIARLYSPWLLLGLAFMTFSVGGSVALLTPRDPATALRIAPEYVLVELDPDVVADIQSQYAPVTTRGRSGMAIREVDGADGSISFLMVIDGAFAPDGNLDEVARGIVSTSGGVQRLDTIAGTPVAVVTTQDQAFVSWIESPFLLAIVGADEATTRAVAAAVLSVSGR